MQRLLDQGISTRRGVMNVHLESAYPPDTWRRVGALANGEEIQETAIVLPLFHQLTEPEQDQVIDALVAAVAQG